MKKENRGGIRKGAGSKPKYKKGTETKTIHSLIPTALEIEVKCAIEVVVKPFMFTNKFGSSEDLE